MYSKEALNSLLQEEMKHHFQAVDIISANHHNIILSILSKESKELFILKILDRRYYNKSLYQKIFSITGNSLLIPFQTFTDTSYIYFVYPHLNTLTEALSTKTINYSTLYTLIFSIGNAAASLHEHNILHLDTSDKGYTITPIPPLSPDWNDLFLCTARTNTGTLCFLLE